VLADARAARGRIHAAAYEQLHRDRYHAALAPSILARVPADLDALMEQVVVNAVSRLGFHVEHVRGRRAYAIEFGNEALIDSLPGVAGGSSFVGSFDREYAVEDENIDFYASGHPLVEGLLAHFDESPKGRVGLVAFYKDGPQVTIEAVDENGAARPGWAEAFRRRALSARARRMKPEDAAAYDWASLVARLAPRFKPRRPHAIAAIIVRE
jgi:hypothetical protein